MKRLLLTISIILFLPLQAWAVNYYVSQSGAGDGSAYATPDSVADFNAGVFGELDDDMVYVIGAVTSTLTLPDSGTSGHEITIASCHTDYGASDDDACTITTTSTAIDINGKDYVNIQGVSFVLSGSGDIGVYIDQGCDYVDVLNCDFTHSGGASYDSPTWGVKIYNNSSGGQVYITIQGSTFHDMGSKGRGVYVDSESVNSEGDTITYLTVTNCYFHDMYNGISSNQQGHAVDPKVIYQTILDYAEYGYFILSSNRFETLQAQAIRVQGNNHTIENNRCYNVGQGYYKTNCFQLSDIDDSTIRFNYINGVCNNAAVTETSGDGNGIFLDAHLDGPGTSAYQVATKSVGNTVSHNWVENCQPHNFNGCGIVHYWAENTDIFANVIVDNDYGLMCNHDYWDTTGAGNARVYNNTFVDNIEQHVRCGKHFDSTKPYYFRNNIFSGGALCFWLGAGVTSAVINEDYSDYYNVTAFAGGNSTLSPGANDITTNPLFISSTDFALQSGSPCRDTGDDSLGTPYNIILNPVSTFTSIPPNISTDAQGSHGTGWEFGAYYYDDSETPPPASYGDILFWWRCEGTTLDANKDSSEGDTSATLSAATIAAEASLRTYDGGSNGLDCDNSSHYAKFDINGNDIFPADGRLALSLRIQTWLEQAQIWKAYKDASNIIRVKMIGADELQFHWKDGGVTRASLETTDLNLAIGTIYLLEFEWSTTDDCLKIYKNGVLAGTASGTLSPIVFGTPTVDALKMGNDSGIASDIHIDLVSISDSLSRDYYDLIVTNTTEDYPGSSSGNNFLGDTDCFAVYSFESGALTTDSQGGNTLVAGTAGTVDTTNYKEKSASIDFEAGSTQHYLVTDANLDANFPLKNGDANGVISVTAWVRLESNSASNAVWSKYDSTANTRSFMVVTNKQDTNNKPALYIGHTGGTASEIIEWHDSNGAVSINTATWYHMTWSFDDSDKSYAIRVRDTNGAVVGTDHTGTATNNINVEDASVGVGTFFDNAVATWPFDGNIDELVIFDKFLTAAESTSIATESYDSTPAATITAIGTATVSSNVVTFSANNTSAETTTGNPNWYIALKLSKVLDVSANGETSTYRWLSGPLTASYRDAIYYGYRLDAASDPYLLYSPDFSSPMRWADFASWGDGSASLQLNDAVLVDGDLEPLDIDHSGLGTDLSGTGTLSGSFPYPSTNPKAFTTVDTWAAAIAAGWYSVPGDNLSFDVEEDVNTDKPGTSGHPITYTGTITGQVVVDEDYIKLNELTIN